MPSFVKLEQVTRVYAGSAGPVCALHPLDLTIGSREFLTILGPSGSGKTTLLNLLAGLDQPSSGCLTVNGLEISRLEAPGLLNYRRDQVAVVFQQLNLLANLTARENLELVLELGGLSGDPVSALSGVGLGQRADHFPHELSGGEQQRVAIARALLRKVPLLLADEPTGNLDAGTGREVLQLLWDVHHQGCCLVLVTHNEEVARLGTRCLRLGDGRVRSDAPVEQRLTPDQLQW